MTRATTCAKRWTWRGRAARRRVRTRWWARCWCATAKWWAAASTPTPDCKHAEIIALERGRRAGARRDALRQPGAVLAPGPHAAVRRRADRRRAWRGWSRPCRIRIRWSRATGFARLRDAGIEVEMAAGFTAEAEKLNEAFVHFMRTGRPLVTLKTAITLDGKISAPDDNRGWITSETRARARAGAAARSRRDPHRHRHGAGRRLPADRPHRAAALPAAAAHRDGFAAAAAARFEDGCRARADDVVVVTTSAAPAERRKALESRGVEGAGRSTARAAARTCASVVEWLAAEKYLSLMIEAGSKLNWTALESGRAWTGSSSTTARRFWAACRRCRWPAASGGGGASDAIRVHEHHAPSDSAGRIRRGRILDVHRDH